MDIWSYICYITALTIYFNTLTADFVYDDRRAILLNQDVNSNSAFSDLWRNDFWGTPLASSNSHGSYRPLCVLTFRFNHWLFGYRPWGYHLTNVILHVLSTGLVLKLGKCLLPLKAAEIGSLLFAVHPIHTEAVAGIVGRADVIACIFYLSSILCYLRHCEQQFVDVVNGHEYNSMKHKLKRRTTIKYGQTYLRSNTRASKLNRFFRFCFFDDVLAKCDFNLKFYGRTFVKSNIYIFLSVFFACLATFSKETGFTALPVCLIYEILLLHRSQINKRKKKSRWKNLEILAVTTLTLLIIRIKLAGFYMPTFSTADNPIAKSDFFTRLFTFFYLPVFNFKLLLFPYTLSFDWGMDSISLITSVFDFRNFLTALFYYVLHIVVKINYKEYENDKFGKRFRNSNLSNRLVSLFLINLTALPFLPTSNLFFYVGFVVAERNLYIPSVGLCLFIGYGYHLITQKVRTKLTNFLFTILVIVFGLRAMLRNNDWRNEENLYKSSVTINPPKAYGNLGSVLSDEGRLAEAEVAFRTALKYRYNMADVHYNLAMLLEKTNRSEEAITSYNLAIKFRPTLAVAYLKLGQLLMHIHREEEAKRIFLKCSNLDGTGLKDPKVHEVAKIEAMINLASIESKNGNYENTLSIYMHAVISAPVYYKPQALYNFIGKTLIKMEKYEEAEKWFRYVTGETELEPHAFLYSNSFLNNSKVERNKWLNIMKRNRKFNDPFIYIQYSQLLFNMKKFKKAAEIMKKLLEKTPQDFELLKNTANMCRIAGLLIDAEEYYRKIAYLNPDASSYSALGTILYLRGKYNESEMAYRHSLELKPDDASIRRNFQKLKCILYNKNNSSDFSKTIK